MYNQLGNACFYSGKYNKALEYHKKDLEIAEKMGDLQGMAKAQGNLGNTFKALGNFESAIRCSPEPEAAATRVCVSIHSEEK